MRARNVVQPSWLSAACDLGLRCIRFGATGSQPSSSALTESRQLWLIGFTDPCVT
jgi:hypothetical protein